MKLTSGTQLAAKSEMFYCGDMALSDREQRLLAEMEQALSADDPALVSTLTGARRRGPGAAIGVAALIAGIATLFAGLIAQQTIVGVVGFVIALVRVIALINAVTSQVAGAKVDRPRGARRSFGKGFTRGLEDRWDQRNNG